MWGSSVGCSGPGGKETVIRQCWISWKDGHDVIDGDRAVSI